MTYSHKLKRKLSTLWTNETLAKGFLIGVSFSAVVNLWTNETLEKGFLIGVSFSAVVNLLIFWMCK